MENNRRLVRGQDLADAHGVLHITDCAGQRDRSVIALEFLFEGVERQFPQFKQHQTSRFEPRDLAA